MCNDTGRHRNDQSLLSFRQTLLLLLCKVMLRIKMKNYLQDPFLASLRESKKNNKMTLAFVAKNQKEFIQL